MTENEKRLANNQRFRNSKEELIEIRKQMMKRNRSKSPNSVAEQTNLIKDSKIYQEKTNKYSNKINLKTSDRSQEISKRLSSGQKLKISKTKMTSLTTKNYSKLPEVIKLKEEQTKKADLLKRLNKAKEYAKSLHP